MDVDKLVSMLRDNSNEFFGPIHSHDISHLRNFFSFDMANKLKVRRISFALLCNSLVNFVLNFQLFLDLQFAVTGPHTSLDFLSLYSVNKFDQTYHRVNLVLAFHRDYRRIKIIKFKFDWLFFDMLIVRIMMRVIIPSQISVPYEDAISIFVTDMAVGTKVFDPPV